MAPSPVPTTLHISYKGLLDKREGLELAHLFVAEDNAAILVKGCLECEAAPVLPALEVNTVPLNHKDCPWGEEQRPG